MAEAIRVLVWGPGEPLPNFKTFDRVIGGKTKEVGGPGWLRLLVRGGSGSGEDVEPNEVEDPFARFVAQYCWKLNAMRAHMHAADEGLPFGGPPTTPLTLYPKLCPWEELIKDGGLESAIVFPGDEAQEVIAALVRMEVPFTFVGSGVERLRYLEHRLAQAQRVRDGLNADPDCHEMSRKIGESTVKSVLRDLKLHCKKWGLTPSTDLQPAFKRYDLEWL